VGPFYTATSGSLLIFRSHQPIDAVMLAAIEMYLRYYCKKQPNVFIFGHTHEPGFTKTNSFGRDSKERNIRKIIEVWNIGSFIENRGKKRAGSFIITKNDSKDGNITLYNVDLDGNVKEESH
jgi:predicted phosphodiesterase